MVVLKRKESTKPKKMRFTLRDVPSHFSKVVGYGNYEVTRLLEATLETFFSLYVSGVLYKAVDATCLNAQRQAIGLDT